MPRRAPAGRFGNALRTELAMAVAVCYDAFGGRCAMPLSPSIRIDDEVHASAVSVAPLMSRSAAQQISHWARIGRELESSREISQRDIERVLACEASYDDLGVREQAVVRAEWSERTEQRLRELDLAARFAATGEPYAELDDDGNVVIRQVRDGEMSTARAVLG